MFTDLACSLGAILLEQYIVDDLCGGHVSYSYGNTYARPYSRLAFQRAAQKIARTPGTMVYGATTMYGPNHAANYAALATYLRVDIYAERTRPAGHAVNPTPVTEADRIPDIDEIIDVHMFANHLVELEHPFTSFSAMRRSTSSPTGSWWAGGSFVTMCSRGFAAAGYRYQRSLRNAAGDPPHRLASGLRTLFGPGAAGARAVCADACRSSAHIRSSSSSRRAKVWSAASIPTSASVSPRPAQGLRRNDRRA